MKTSLILALFTLTASLSVHAQSQESITCGFVDSLTSRLHVAKGQTQISAKAAASNKCADSSMFNDCEYYTCESSENINDPLIDLIDIAASILLGEEVSPDSSDNFECAFTEDSIIRPQTHIATGETQLEALGKISDQCFGGGRFSLKCEGILENSECALIQ